MSRVSVVIAALNEGSLLRQTLETVRQDLKGVDHEIIVADDGSEDGSTSEPAASLLDCDVLLSMPQRLGPACARARGVQEASGDVLIFLDGHCRPAPGALPRLAEVVRQASGALVAPAMGSLDQETFQGHPNCVPSAGLSLDLIPVECRYVGFDDSVVYPADFGPEGLMQVPAISAACCAIGREVYDRLGGWDTGMRIYGVEDLDLSITAWFAGYGPFSYRHAMVYHRYRASFDNYWINMSVVRSNHLRMIYTHACRADDPATIEHWAAWTQLARQRWGDDEYLRAWREFESRMPTAEPARRRNEAFAREAGKSLGAYAARSGYLWPPGF